MRATWPPLRPRRVEILLRGDLTWLGLGAAAAVAIFALALSLRLGGFVMKRFPLLAVLAIAAVGLSGCVTTQLVKDLEPQDKKELALRFLERCGGTVDIGAAGASGQLGGGISGNFRISGTCPVPEPPVVRPLKDLGRPAAADPPL